jgi:hypothetical protein
MGDQHLNEDIVKPELHSVAYNSETQQFDGYPSSRIRVNDDWELAIALHKWDKYIALYSLGVYNCPNKDRIQSFETSINPQVIPQIENGIVPDCVHVYKYSVNVWRKVEFKRTKWAFSEPKPSKDDPAHVQRVIENAT